MDVQFDEETERLKSVFDLLDSEKTGFISVGRFVEVASDYFCNSELDSTVHESMTAVIRALDPKGKGQIQFTQFCEGIKRFLELTAGPATPADAGGRSVFSRRSVSADDNSSLVDVGNEDSIDGYSPTALITSDVIDGRLSPINLWPSPSPPSREHHQGRHHCRTGSGGYQRQTSSVEDDRDSGIEKFSDHYESHSHFVRSEEQNIEYLSEESNSSDVPDLDTSSIATPRGSKLSLLTNGKHVTPSAIASDLYRSSNNRQQMQIDSSCQSSVSDTVYDDIDGSFLALNDKVKQLENRLHLLTEDQARDSRKQEKLKEENSQLIERRVHVLEEQLRDVENRAREQMTEEQRKHREVLVRSEKDRSREIEILSQSLQHIEREYAVLKDEVPHLRGENERLRKETGRQEVELEKLQQTLSSVMVEYKTLQEHNQSELQKSAMERTVHNQLVDELSKELEELRSFKAERLARSPQARDAEISRSHRRVLEEQLNRLKSENASLREQTDELQAQLLHRHVEEGRQLLMINSGSSIAAELENVSQDELKAIINKEREANLKLRDYIERITLRILEKNPSILEIGTK